MTRKHTKKEFKHKVEWFIANKYRMSRQRRNWTISGMEHRYSDFLPYEKYGYYGDGMVEYINNQITKKMTSKE
jgi:glycine/serine hydroxymethyltransferase